MLKCKTRTQMAAEYGVSRRTFYNMLNREGLVMPPGKVTPAFQEKIYKQFGYPPGWDDQEEDGEYDDSAGSTKKD